MSENHSTIQTQCPYDDCQHLISIPGDAEEADIIVCRSTKNDQCEGCNRNTEITSIKRDSSGNLLQVQLDVLEIDEDWGE